MIHPEVFYSNITEMKLDLVTFCYQDQFLQTKTEDQPRFCNVKRLSLKGDFKRYF